DAMAHRDPITHGHRSAHHGVDDGPILDVAIRSDADGFDVSPQHTLEPHAGIFANIDAANDVGAGGNVRRPGNAGSPPRQGENHPSPYLANNPLVPQTYDVNTEARKAAR